MSPMNKCNVNALIPPTKSSIASLSARQCKGCRNRELRQPLLIFIESMIAVNGSKRQCETWKSHQFQLDYEWTPLLGA
jgi:hypothetical protein